MRTAPRPVAVAPQPHRDLADANRKPHANAPQRDRLPTFNRCEPHRTASAPRPVAVAPQPHRDLADANRKPHANAPQRDRLPTFNRCEPHRTASAPRPVAVAPQPHRDLADANRKPHANAPQRDRLPTFNRCAPHRIRTEVGCPACNVADAPRPGRGSAPHVAECEPLRSKTGCRGSAPRPVADVHRVDWPISPKCTRGWANVTRLPSGKILPPYPVTGCQRAPNGRCPAKRQEAIADNADG
jgi:hypothetical protein